MKYTSYTVALFCIALAFGNNAAHAADPPPAAAAVPRPEPKPVQKPDLTQTRAELDQVREQMRDLSKKMAELSLRLGDSGPRSYAYRYIGDPDKGMIGVVLADDENYTRINAITPGGPADKAGLRIDDVIVHVRGGGTDARSNEMAKEALRNLKVGQEVTLNVLRDGKTFDVKIKAERREPFNLALSLGSLDSIGQHTERELDAAHIDENQITAMAIDAQKQAVELGRAAAEQRRFTAEQQRHFAEQVRRYADTARNATPWWGLNLTSLNPDLVSYFGTDRGVLVLSTDADTAKTLKSGDVLLAIDGKKVERPEDAMRLLREAGTGRDVKVDILRQHKNQTLSMKAPEFKGLFAMPTPPTPLTPPAPLTPPTPLTPPAPLTPPLH